MARKRSDNCGTFPLVSVLIPTHNRADILFDRALPSVLGQSYRYLEIIVACHGCTDETVDRLSRLWRFESRLRIIEVPRRRTYPPTAFNHWLAGPVAPLNAALKVARGDWLARIDDDDQWMPDHVERLLDFARAGDYEFVSSAYDRHDDCGNVFRVAHDGEDPPIGGTQTWLWRSYLRFMKWNPDCWRKRWNRVNDTDLAQRMRNAGVRIGWLDEVTAIIRPRPGETETGSAAYLGNAEATEDRYSFR